MSIHLLSQKTGQYAGWFIAFMLLFLLGCSKSPDSTPVETNQEPVLGCDGQTYIMPSESPYVLPFPVGQTFQTGLTNCSSSFHGPGQPDQYAFDFNMPTGTPFVAARGGIVFEVVENASGKNNLAKFTNSDNYSIVGNYVTIDHGDSTFGLYLHSPDDGIAVTVGDSVQQGDVLGVTGRSGLAGYPHLHFIVVKYPPEFPYSGIAVSFSNALPADVVLQGDTQYKAVAY
ncbi:MAG: M23 family metallopeptidase [Calditrichaeota bacterium]|nr:M23 family metallopeptidase [Calditrichota bacterium]MCB0269722.1 M23 family metallopeptidase [Calditrichota bacterium]MCB9068064.1 M23 family metallopeptidase [Calditrichia bacterium]